MSKKIAVLLNAPFFIKDLREHRQVQVGPDAEEDGDVRTGCNKQVKHFIHSTFCAGQKMYHTVGI